MSSSSGTTLSLADVSSGTVAALWSKIYDNLSPVDVARSMVVCKTFLEMLPPLITTIDYSTPAFTQSSAEKFCRSDVNLRTLYLSLEYDEELDLLDWTKVTLPHLRQFVCVLLSNNNP